MAVPVIQSSSTYSWTANTSPVITKPTGLSVGDLMVAFIYTLASAGSIDSMSTPAGWTKFLDESVGSPTTRAYGFWKIADSGDTAASNFTFTCDTTSSVNAGYLARITGHYASAPITGSDADVTTGTSASPTFTISQYTYTDEALLFMGFVGNNSVAETLTGSGYTTSGTNPTWTEVLEISSLLGTDESAFLAAASGTALQTVTSISMSTSGSGITNYIGFFVVLAPQVNETATHTLLSADADFFAPTATSGTSGTNTLLSADADFFAPSSLGTEPSIWTAVTKS